MPLVFTTRVTAINILDQAFVWLLIFQFLYFRLSCSAEDQFTAVIVSPRNVGYSANTVVHCRAK